MSSPAPGTPGTSAPIATPDASPTKAADDFDLMATYRAILRLDADLTKAKKLCNERESAIRELRTRLEAMAVSFAVSHEG